MKKAFAFILFAGVFCTLLVLSGPTSAETAAHGAHDAVVEAAHDGAEHAAGAEDHTSSGGLPQFDVSTYPSQIFWLVITFALMYVLFSNKTLPAISGVIENRRETIQGDLGTAEELKKEAESVQAAYEAKLDQVRQDTTKTMATMRTKLAQKATDANNKFRDKAAHEIKALDVRIADSKNEALNEMNDMVAELARDAAQNIAGIKPDMKKATAIVETLSKKEAA